MYDIIQLIHRLVINISGSVGFTNSICLAFQDFSLFVHELCVLLHLFGFVRLKTAPKTYGP